ncbi:phosphoribosylformylglycinamidine synthase-like [Diadema antillarum]|uniref:phosphoribosylformylglycinamidine synthase-like n=1 Tax=Diadema antillarum TaxID=105358 RepID=UPI003A8C15AA
MAVLHYFTTPALSDGAHQTTLAKVKGIVGQDADVTLQTETCYNIQVDDGDLSAEDVKKLLFIIGIPFQEDRISSTSVLDARRTDGSLLIEIGPRLNFSTAWSTNAVSICQSAGLGNISRIERSRRFLIAVNASAALADAERAIVAALHDRMTECRYSEPLKSFAINVNPEDVYDVDIMEQGQAALRKANKDLGLAFDEWDLEYYTDMFVNKVKRNPTSVECFDLAQSNSEHSRHWFFKGRMVVDGEEKEDSLFKMVMKTQEMSNPNNVIKFSDNSSAIKGFTMRALYPASPGSTATPMTEKSLDRHIIFTAETHNFPTGVAPFSGATTGTGGRIRDVQSAGRGSHVVAGTAGYCFGNLHIPGYQLPWEDPSFVYPSNMARPLEVAVEASNGASDYGNKFGEPVLAGFARSFGMLISGDERREWVKPIMFSGGIGSLEEGHIKKDQPATGMKVVKLGGPVYRIGVGGGAASSIQVQGDNTEDLDFGAVQRGDAEMEQKLNRVVRACIEMGEKNPICSIHDQGAGGNGNVLKEICEPAGAVIRTKAFQLGDPTLTTLEIWGAEYQESNAILVKEEDDGLLSNMCRRERCPVNFVGEITGDGKIRLEDEKRELMNGSGDGSQSPTKKSRVVQYPVDLDLEWVLGSMPRKVFKLDRIKPTMAALNLPSGLTVSDALDRVLRLPSVASKRYLTNKVDRSVTGLVAQQQCVGPLHTPLADVAVTALSHFETVGGATAIGEQPIKGLVDAAAGARMAVAESLTNLVFARVTALKDVKCSGNWMWPAKLPGEGAALYDACQAMCELMAKLGIAVDGGKDSLSMAARVEGKTVKAPGALVISTYVGCPDITATVTPDLKCPAGKGTLLYVDLSCGHRRLGGSALGQCYSQLGDVVPDVDDAALLVNAFNVTQDLIAGGLLSGGHDISDGGLVTCVLEMAFAGNCGIEVNLSAKSSTLEHLFAEELGLVLEVAPENAAVVCQKYSDMNVPCTAIGYSVAEASSPKIVITVKGESVVDTAMTGLRDVWEATSFQLERLQTNPTCVEEEEAQLKHRKAPPYKLTFDPQPSVPQDQVTGRPKVAVIREEGSNGDREMLASFHMAGFQAWDVNMQDLASGSVSLHDFRGVAFVGGFSFADVCGSAKGWAAAILYNPVVRAEFDAFRARPDTFSLGVCNGCQLMGLLGWVAPDGADSVGNKAACKQGVFLDHNTSERYESRFVTVKLEKSPALMLRGMEDSVLGIWVAHGEGKMKFASDAIQSQVIANHLTPIRYVDDEGTVTMQYPLNPNGSPQGIAALCSPDGRHLAMMPHPERCTLTWQWPWMPQDWRRDLKASPWLRIFQNAYTWCLDN